MCVILDWYETTVERDSYFFGGEDAHGASVFSQGHTHFSQQGFSAETGTYSVGFSNVSQCGKQHDHQ